MSEVENFEWDIGNIDKNWFGHGVANEECEEVFFDKDKKIIDDFEHSNIEKRLIVIGETKRQRLLFIVYTIRNNKIRIISARDADKKEKKLYEEAIKITKI